MEMSAIGKDLNIQVSYVCRAEVAPVGAGGVESSSVKRPLEPLN